MKALVYVTLKPDVLDPQGSAIQRACSSLGYEDIQDVRQGKLFEITLDAADEASARKLVEELAEKVLANGVIEDFHLQSLSAVALPGGDAAAE
jgi:phosphoribosylformylglycinamidine synthase PurS subunit